MDLEILKEYRKKVILFLLGIIMLSATAAGVVFPVLKGLGLYNTVLWETVIVFCVCILAEDMIGVWLIKQSRAEEVMSERTERIVKLYLILIQLVNLNLITWCFPSKESWMFVFYFLILMALFLDIKVIGICCILDAVSLVILFLGKPVTRPINTLFVTDSLLRLICIFLSLAGVIIFVVLVNKFLLNAKKDQLEKNNEHVMSVLNSVEVISERLHEAGISLSLVSENESASAEELAATSEQLAESSKQLSSKTGESMENLGELSEWESVVADNVEQVKTTSGDLLNKSTENEKLLNDLHIINAEVSESMRATTNIAGKLSDAVREIDATLTLIREISSSTNLLALNASIEAARAGDAGRGFAVVATEVGNLANSTQESLNQVEAVIACVQNNVKEITTQVEENYAKLETQNKYFANVFKSMQNITELLHVSVEAVSTMGQAHNKQAEVIQRTVSINQDIAEGIRNTAEQFDAINAMAESNANDTNEVTIQANTINSMVDEMNGLLKQNV